MSHYNSVTKYKIKLQELHDLIKENPFRKGYEEHTRFGKGYFELVYEFAETFYHLIRDIRENKLQDIEESDKKLAKVDTLDFIHDFYSACNIGDSSIRNYDFAPEESMELLHKQEELLELDISCIHVYLETGRFDKYPFRRKGEILWSEWNEDTRRYENCPQSPNKVISR